MRHDSKLDYRLVWAMLRRCDELPGDLRQICDHLGTIDDLLAEKAAELEPSWEQACAAAAEIATLQELEITVAERAIEVRADSLGAVRAKLAIWRALAAGAEDGDARSPRNRLILSIDADLERLSERRSE